MTIKEKQKLEKEGFRIPDINSLNPNDSMNGIILKDGTLILCNGYNEHRWMYPFLYDMKLVDAPDWIDEMTAIHISSSQLNGKVAFDITNGIYGNLASQEQLNTLFKLRKCIIGSYGDRETVVDILYQHVSRMENHGGKYNGLSFLKKFYKNINLPQFSKHSRHINNTKYMKCIRTSPRYSLPGLLNSKFNLKSGELLKSIHKMREDFELHKNVREGNELNYFYQEQLTGPNGVCHARNGKFTYSASLEQGDIVKGKKGKFKLNSENLEELKKIALELSKDFNKSIQLEFVISEGKVYIVQLRILENEPESAVRIQIPETAICFGKTFSYGNIDVNVKDLLIVEKDGDSELLLGKKALIVTNNVEFSHLLALSKVLEIPSMYGTGKVNIPKGKKKIKFVAYNEKSWVL